MECFFIFVYILVSLSNISCVQLKDYLCVRMCVLLNVMTVNILSVAINRVATYRELDNDLLRQAAFLTLVCINFSSLFFSFILRNHVRFLLPASAVNVNYLFHF